MLFIIRYYLISATLSISPDEGQCRGGCKRANRSKTEELDRGDSIGLLLRGAHDVQKSMKYNYLKTLYLKHT
jgi:hypothetical protein